MSIVYARQVLPERNFPRYKDIFLVFVVDNETDIKTTVKLTVTEAKRVRDMINRELSYMDADLRRLGHAA